MARAVDLDDPAPYRVWLEKLAPYLPEAGGWVPDQGQTRLFLGLVDETGPLSKPTEKIALDLDYETPDKILDPVRSYMGGRIWLDPATSILNPTRARAFYTPEKNGLVQDWKRHGERGVFVNPPYGKPLRSWLEKIGNEGARGYPIVALLPCNRSEQAYWSDMMALANAVCWIRKRVSFLRPVTRKVAKGNPYSSMLVGFNVDLDRFYTCFHPLGRTQGLVRLGPTLAIPESNGLVVQSS